ncbi:hypothetical protein TREES_T100016195 [Tupaia chinensis]|uniref:Death domain-containing protein n=1 Tax=Tupaia chinensis TaxID=246437 RepID=L9JLS1_TUPCH|nr:hypothetical protein TREES_T100016195 [Tupaia chinensis]
MAIVSEGQEQEESTYLCQRSKEKAPLCGLALGFSLHIHSKLPKDLPDSTSSGAPRTPVLTLVPAHFSCQHEEVEVSRSNKGWQDLAGHLGYQAETVETIAWGQVPASTLLKDWAIHEGSRATLRMLVEALMAMGREDVIQARGPPAGGCSVGNKIQAPLTSLASALVQGLGSWGPGDLLPESHMAPCWGPRHKSMCLPTKRCDFSNWQSLFKCLATQLTDIDVDSGERESEGVKGRESVMSEAEFPPYIDSALIHLFPSPILKVKGHQQCN